MWQRLFKFSCFDLVSVNQVITISYTVGLFFFHLSIFSPFLSFLSSSPYLSVFIFFVLERGIKLLSQMVTQQEEQTSYLQSRKIKTFITSSLFKVNSFNLGKACRQGAEVTAWRRSLILVWKFFGRVFFSNAVCWLIIFLRADS